MSHLVPRVFQDDLVMYEIGGEGPFLLARGGLGALPFTLTDQDAVKDIVAKYIGLESGEEISGLEIKHQRWLAHLTAPGFLDQTEMDEFDTEAEAWDHLVSNHPEVFTWVVQGGTAHIYMPSDAASKAMVDHVQSIRGSRLERDGEFVYVPTGGGEDDVEEDAEAFAEDAEAEVVCELANYGFEVQDQ